MAYTGSSVAGGEGNTTHVVTDETFLGKPLEFVIVDMISAVNAKTAKDSTSASIYAWKTITLTSPSAEVDLFSSCLFSSISFFTISNYCN